VEKIKTEHIEDISEVLPVPDVFEVHFDPGTGEDAVVFVPFTTSEVLPVPDAQYDLATLQKHAVAISSAIDAAQSELLNELAVAQLHALKEGFDNDVQP